MYCQNICQNSSNVHLGSVHSNICKIILNFKKGGKVVASFPQRGQFPTIIKLEKAQGKKKEKKDRKEHDNYPAWWKQGPCYNYYYQHRVYNRSSIICFTHKISSIIIELYKNIRELYKKSQEFNQRWKKFTDQWFSDQFRMTDPFENLMKSMDYSYWKMNINHKILYVISKALWAIWSLSMKYSGTYWL